MTDPSEHVPTERVLVVEDDAMLQAFLVLKLEQEGFGVLTAASGEDMFRVLAQDDVDLILLDLNLPDGDGLSLARKIREHSDVPIVIATARQSRDDRMIALGLGADDYVTKPFDPEELALRIRNVIARAGGRAKGGNGTGGRPPRSPGSRRPSAAGGNPGNGLETLFPETQAGDNGGGLAGPRPRRWRMFAAASMLTAGAAMGALWLISSPAAPVASARAAQKSAAPITTLAESPAPVKPAPRKSFRKSSALVSTSAAAPSTIPAAAPAATMTDEGSPRSIAEVLGYGWVLRSQCDPIPRVEWWKYKDHESVAAYVNRRHRGNWLPYLGKWVRRLVKLQDIQNRESSAVTNSGLVLRGAELGAYIKKMQKRLSVTRCLADESAKAAATKMKLSDLYRS